MQQEIDTVIICHCGNTENPHRFRHEFTPSMTVDKWKDDGGYFFKIDADDFKGKEIEGRCKFSQCGRVKHMHVEKTEEERKRDAEKTEEEKLRDDLNGLRPLLGHEFEPGDVVYSRTINFTIPLDTVCRACEQNLANHESLTHAFTTKVLIDGRTKHDVVTIRGKNFDQTIIWDTEPLIDEMVVVGKNKPVG